MMSKAENQSVARTSGAVVSVAIGHETASQKMEKCVFEVDVGVSSGGKYY